MTITFYDIAMAPPREKTSCSPNPTKSRLVLNAKQVEFTTQYVQLPDIVKLRDSKHVAAVRQFTDGSEYQTLPLIWDSATKTHVGDSFDIAVYLHEQYPESGLTDLFPAKQLKYEFTQSSTFLVPLSEIKHDTFLEYRKFNNSVDALFTSHVSLAVQGLPFDPERCNEIRAEFMRRAGATSWDAFKLEGAPRTQLLEAFIDALSGLRAAFEGIFIFGSKPCYADFIIGRWVHMFRICLPISDWEQVSASNGGFLARFYNALQIYLSK